MALSFTQQFPVILKQGFRAEMAEKDRLISPLLFAATMLILFAFAVGQVKDDLVIKIYLAQTFLTLLFALQTSFARIFDPDQQDKVFQLLQCYPIEHSAWFLAKYVLVMLVGTSILVPTMFLGGILNDAPNLQLLNPYVFLIAFLALGGLASLGVLLSAMTLNASGREILFPLLYFPLATPVLLAAIQSSLAFLNPEPTELPWQWIGLLTSFDVIYFTLGILLFGELVETEA
jgi:heme exporter protein B